MEWNGIAGSSVSFRTVGHMYDLSWKPCIKSNTATKRNTYMYMIEKYYARVRVHACSNGLCAV